MWHFFLGGSTYERNIGIEDWKLEVIKSSPSVFCFSVRGGGGDSPYSEKEILIDFIKLYLIPGFFIGV